MARAGHLPLVAELVWPLPKIATVEGIPANQQTLNQLLAQSPGYEWKMEGKVLHFYNKKLRQSQFNFLYWKFSRFTVPSNLSDFKLWFPGRVIGLLEGYTGEGGATTGFGDTEFEKRSLNSETLDDMTGLDVLLHVANEAPMFYTVLVFPSSSPSRSDAENRVSWQWGSLDEKLRPLYTQPLGCK